LSRRIRRTGAVLATAALVAGSAGLASTAQAQSARHTLAGSKPAWATTSHRHGAASAGTPVEFRVYLDWRNGAAAAAYARAVSTPGSTSYGKFLTPAQFKARYAPAASTVDGVRSWLRAQGFRVGHVPANNKYVEATGTLGQVARAFDTSFATYSVHGKTLRSNTSPLSVPGSVHGVEGVLGLDQSGLLMKTNATSQPPAGFRNAQPCSAYWGEKTVTNTPTPDGQALPSSPEAFAPCGYAGEQLQGAYGVDGAITSGDDGRGVTVAVVDAYASPTIQKDVDTYSTAHGLPSPVNLTQKVAPGTYIRGDNPQHSPSGWSGEETLDVEAVHTMAPGAHILYVGSPNNRQDMDAALNWIVANKAANIVTNSYGFSTEALPPGYIKPQNDVLMQAAAEGISMFFSSGDDGDETFGDPSVAPTPDWPASSPWVTAVGGTSLGVGSDNSRVFELGWETTKSTLDKATTTWNSPFYIYGSGGGTSRLFPQPSYQQGVVPDELSKTYSASGPAMRVVPDVAALGDPTTGMRVGQTQTFPDGTYYDEYRIGGTSLSSPLYAGMFALARQAAGHDFGLANPVLYGAPSSDITKAQRSSYPGAVRVDYVNGVDATKGYVYSARWFDQDESLTIHVRDGYDDVTGVGSPTGQAWLDYVSAQ
jgi:subtilase family serine protease